MTNNIAQEIINKMAQQGAPLIDGKLDLSGMTAEQIAESLELIFKSTPQ